MVMLAGWEPFYPSDHYFYHARQGAWHMKKKRNHKWIATLVVTVLALGGILLFLWCTGFFTAAQSMDGIQDYIARFSPYSHLVFFLIQLASVVVAPIPSNITAAGGALLFGMWPAFLLTAGAVVLGSAVVFWLARVLGHSFAGRFVSQKVSDKYLDLIRRKRDIFLVLVFLFPFFPDDLICILAGLTDIGFLRFLVIVLLTRPWGLLVASAVGSSVISIPLWAMALIGLAGLALFLVSMKYGDRWEARLLEKFKQ